MPVGLFCRGQLVRIVIASQAKQLVAPHEERWIAVTVAALQRITRRARRDSILISPLESLARSLGLLRLHTLWPAGLLNRLKRPLSRGSDPSGYPTEPLVSFQIDRQLSGWIPPPLVIRAFRAHCQKATLDDVRC